MAATGGINVEEIRKKDPTMATEFKKNELAREEFKAQIKNSQCKYSCIIYSKRFFTCWFQFAPIFYGAVLYTLYHLELRVYSPFGVPGGLQLGIDNKVAPHP